MGAVQYPAAETESINISGGELKILYVREQRNNRIVLLRIVTSVPGMMHCYDHAQDIHFGGEGGNGDMQ